MHFQRDTLPSCRYFSYLWLNVTHPEITSASLHEKRCLPMAVQRSFCFDAVKKNWLIGKETNLLMGLLKGLCLNGDSLVLTTTHSGLLNTFAMQPFTHSFMHCIYIMCRAFSDSFLRAICFTILPKDTSASGIGRLVQTANLPVHGRPDPVWLIWVYNTEFEAASNNYLRKEV